MRRFQTGDAVVYCKSKASLKPGPRAEDVHPSEHGDGYRYLVEKYWRVVSVTGADLEIVTRTGKRHTLRADDPMLRKASFMERVTRAEKFPPLSCVHAS
jgi:hypothetical protein